MAALRERLPSPQALVRLALVGFVLAWLFGPSELRLWVPIWLPFLVAVLLELQFFAGALRSRPAAARERGPLPEDRARYGYGPEPAELLLVRDRHGELWVPYRGEEGEELAALIHEERLRQEGEDVEEDIGEPDAAGPPERRPLGRLLTGLAVAAALGALVWLVETRTGWDGLDEDDRAAAVARFSEEASRVAGKPVEIRCDESGDRVGVVQHADGVAIVGGSVAWLTTERCHDLYRLAFEGEERGESTGRAIAVLAHEAWHLGGVRDEATTECYALQSGVEVGRSLGLTSDTAARLMRQQLVENVSATRRDPAYRITAECRDGGPLDLDPASTRFP